MNKLTKKLLKECEKVGYKYVAISEYDKRNKTCREWPFASFEGSIFCSPSVKIDGWPAIWSIVKRVGLKMGSGNSNQAQVDDAERLDKGSYRLPNHRVQPAGADSERQAT